MTKDEALKMAIATLQNARRKHFYCEDTWYSCPKHEDGCADDRQGDECNCGADSVNFKIQKTINACKEALKQPAQEPVAWMAHDLHTSWLSFQKEALKDAKEIEPLYTSPHQWQQLTQNEINKFCSIVDCEISASSRNIESLDDVNWEISGLEEFARAIEQALRSKNS